MSIVGTSINYYDAIFYADIDLLQDCKQSFLYCYNSESSLFGLLVMSILFLWRSLNFLYREAFSVITYPPANLAAHIEKVPRLPMVWLHDASKAKSNEEDLDVNSFSKVGLAS